MGLNRQTSGLDLSRFIVDNAKQYLSNTDVTVAEVFGHSGATDEDDKVDIGNMAIRRFDDGMLARPQKFDLSGISLALGRKTPTLSQNAQNAPRMIVPIATDIGPQRLIVFDGLQDDADARVLALQISELYEHQIRLMDHRERDQLTGLLNRQTFNQFFQNNLERAKGNDQTASLAVLDIDHFKQVNDNYGHLFGDEVLLHFSQVMRATFRFNDPLFRFGGEEFIVLLSADDPDGAKAALERFRQAIEDYEFPGVGKVTVSIGAASYAQNELPTSVVDRADKALYYAKENGRNQVVLYSDIAGELETLKAEPEIDLF